MSDGLRAKYKRAFVSGLATLLPTILTISVFVFCFNFVNDIIAKPVNQGIVLLLKTEPAKEWYWQRFLDTPDSELSEVPPPGLTPEELDRFVPFSERVPDHVPAWLGFVIAITMVLFVGFLFRGYVGRQALQFVERIIRRVPLIKVIYPYAKQVTEFFFDQKKPIQYESAVAIEYPRRGIWCLGFVTSQGFRELQEATDTELVTIFIPSSPTPFTGYTIMVPKSEVQVLNLTVDEALRFTISGGVLLPEAQMSPLALKTRKLERQQP